MELSVPSTVVSLDTLQERYVVWSLEGEHWEACGEYANPLDALRAHPRTLAVIYRDIDPDRDEQALSEACAQRQGFDHCPNWGAANPLGGDWYRLQGAQLYLNVDEAWLLEPTWNERVGEWYWTLTVGEGADRPRIANVPWRYLADVTGMEEYVVSPLCHFAFRQQAGHLEMTHVANLDKSEPDWEMAPAPVVESILLALDPTLLDRLTVKNRQGENAPVQSQDCGYLVSPSPGM